MQNTVEGGGNFEWEGLISKQGVQKIARYHALPGTPTSWNRWHAPCSTAHLVDRFIVKNFFAEFIQNVSKRILNQNLEIEIFSRVKFFPGILSFFGQNSVLIHRNPEVHTFHGFLWIWARCEGGVSGGFRGFCSLLSVGNLATLPPTSPRIPFKGIGHSKSAPLLELCAPSHRCLLWSRIPPTGSTRSLQMGGGHWTFDVPCLFYAGRPSWRPA